LDSNCVTDRVDKINSSVRLQSTVTSEALNYDNYQLFVRITPSSQHLQTYNVGK